MAGARKRALSWAKSRSWQAVVKWPDRHGLDSLWFSCTFPIYEKSYRPWPCSTMESHKSHVPNHQPEVIVDKLVSPEKEHLLAIGETQSHISGYLTYYSTPLENNHPPQWIVVSPLQAQVPYNGRRRVANVAAHQASKAFLTPWMSGVGALDLKMLPKHAKQERVQIQ